ncbi:MAG: sialate O-acetylesterase, partial [Christensenellales bacterium]
MKEAVIEEYVQSDSINSYQSSELTYYEIPEEVTQPVIPNVFGDNMLIQRDKSFRVWGLAPSGAKVEVYLKTQDTKKAVLASGVLAAEDNSFVVEMPAMSGSVKNYDLIINFPDNEFSKTVKNVVFGDLFLASGQSNMQVSVYDDYDEAEIMEKANNPNIRYYNPPIMPVGGTDLDTEYPYHPQLSPQNYTLTWGVGTDSSFMGLKSVSSVAVNAAIKMYELLNKEKEEVPVGLMNLPVGGTTILSWLPMSASLDEDFKTLMGDRGIYSEEDYNNPQNNPGGFWNQYGALFNSKIAPVRYMNICGTLWYQGESDLGNTTYQHSMT